MATASSESGEVPDEWCAHHFDHLSPHLAHHLHEVLTRMREDHPVTQSDAYGGFWVVKRLISTYFTPAVVAR